jgi:cyclopropane-fatty-acyl-phospholipid synthase
MLALGEAFMEGEVDFVEGDMLGLLRIIYADMGPGGIEASWTKAVEGLRLAFRRLHQLNTASRSRRNVERHYDLSGDFYRLFLDEDMQYSCAYFERPDMTLEEAQLAKKRHIAAKLKLQPGQTVLDIGAGWGGLGLYLAQETGAEVTGITLSSEQLERSRERARRAGLVDKVRFHLRDYREERGTYDRIVSVGMFEHVGTRQYRTFFRKVRNLLNDGGIALLHSIGRFSPPAPTNPWMRKYIFPGGYVPALSEVLAAIELERLCVTDIEVLRLHYARTLRHWRLRFMQNRETVSRLYDERFCRMWEYYLAGCEVAFRHMGQMVFQLQFARRQDAVPLTRDYLADWEREHLDAAMAAD